MARRSTPAAPPAPKSLLSSLQIVDEKNPKKKLNEASSKFVEALERQITYVEMEMEGKALPAQGSPDNLRKPMLMYWKKGDTYYITVRYGTNPMDVSGDKKILEIKNLSHYKEVAMATVKAGNTLEEVKNTFQTLINATVETKELEPFINHIAALMSDLLQGARDARGKRGGLQKNPRR